MENLPYAFVAGVQVCTPPDIAYAVNVIERFHYNSGIIHWEAAKQVVRDLRRTKDSTFTFQGSDDLCVVRYSDSDFARCPDNNKSNSGYVFILAGRTIFWKSVKHIFFN